MKIPHSVRGWVALVAAALTLGLMLPSGGPATAATTPGDDVLQRLKAIPGLTVVSEQKAPAGYRFFSLTFKQPADQRRPNAGTFEQRLTLLHRGYDRPTVLYTSGYNTPTTPGRTELTRLVDGNQISMEYRFFTPSRPDPADWKTLDIWQAATDEHRVIQAFRALYPKKWVTTGASKGGMTATYHRRFYPHDVDATVAYVAPNEVEGQQPYNSFFDTVGTADCRQKLTAVDRAGLLHRAELLPMLTAAAEKNQWTFNQVGSADRALESTIAGTPWAFWQYHGLAECSTIPGPDASVQTLYDFFDKIDQWDSETDAGIEPFVPYYYQAGTQLGDPSTPEGPVKDLLHYPDVNARTLVPASIPMRWDPHAMPDIDRWVKYSGNRMMYIYGQNDPWSVEQFKPGPGTRDSYWYTVPGGNHNSEIGELPADQRNQATATVQRWLGVSGAFAPQVRTIPGLDDQPEPRYPL